MRKNINLAYALVFLNNSFFWYAPWLLYLLNFLTFSQAAILQSIGLLVSVLAEVPTGALSDLIGRKRTLHIAFLLTAVGEISMAFGRSFPQFVLTYMIIYIGYSFYSGTIESLVYDTLVEHGQEDGYGRVVSRFFAWGSLGTAIASISGGFMYQYWIGLPFLLTGVFKLMGFFVCFWLVEPKIDTEKFSWNKLAVQTTKGFQLLFNKKLIGFSLLLLSFEAFHVVAYEIVDDLAVIDFGYVSTSIGILYAIAVFLTIPGSLMYEKVSKKIPPIVLVYIGILFLGTHYLITPWIGIVVWTGVFLARVFFAPFQTNAMSEILNKHTPSRIRATTLSTYSMLKTIPFVILSSYIGFEADRIGIRNFAAIFFGLMLVVTIPQIVLLYKSRFGLKD